MTAPNYYNWDDLPETPMAARIGRRMVSGDKMTAVMLNLAKGATVGQHQHPHEQLIYVLSGKIEFESNAAKRIVSSGDVVHLPSQGPHGGIALEDTVTLEVFSPTSEDFLTNAPHDYMQP